MNMVEKIIKDNYQKVNQKNFTYLIKMEAMKYRRWSVIKPLVQRYIDHYV